MFIATAVSSFNLVWQTLQSMTPSKRSMPRQTDSPSLKKRKQLTMDDYLSSVYFLLRCFIYFIILIYSEVTLRFFWKLSLWYCGRGRRKNKWTNALKITLGNGRGGSCGDFWYGQVDISSEGLVTSEVQFCWPIIFVFNFCGLNIVLERVIGEDLAEIEYWNFVNLPIGDR